MIFLRNLVAVKHDACSVVADRFCPRGVGGLVLAIEPLVAIAVTQSERTPPVKIMAGTRMPFFCKTSKSLEPLFEFPLFEPLPFSKGYYVSRALC